MLEQTEALAARAGLVPPGQPAGWLLSQALAESPELSDIDFSRPVWMAVMPEKKDAGPEDELEFLLVAGVKGNGEKVAKKMAEQLRVSVQGSLIIAASKTLPAAIGKPQTKPFRFPASMKPVRAQNELFAYVKLDAFPSAKAAMASDQASDRPNLSPEMRELYETFDAEQDENLEQIAGLGAGLHLGELGISLNWYLRPKPGTELAAFQKRLKNVATPLIRGLPAANFMLVFGTTEVGPWIEPYIEPFVRGAKAEIQAVDEKDAAELDGLLKRIAGSCAAMTVGVVGGSSMDAIQVLGSGTCRPASRLTSSIAGLVDWSNARAKAAAKGSLGQATTLDYQAKAFETSGVSFDLVRFPSSGPDASGDAQLKRALAVGAPSASRGLFGWNATAGALGRLVESAKANAPFKSSTRQARVQAALISPRFYEGYMQVGPIVSTFAPPEATPMMGPLRILMNQMPPLGFAARTLPDGSQLGQLIVPEEMAQLAAAFAQMMRQNQPR